MFSSTTFRRGLTLLELLLVIVLVAMTAAALAMNAATAGEQASARQAMYHILEMDQRARLLARTSGSVAEIAVSEDGAVVELHSRGSDRRIVRRDLPLHLTCHIVTASGESALVIDRAGQSEDYRIDFRRDHETILTQHIAGLTGHVRNLEAQP